MTDADHQELGLLAKAVIVVAIVLFVAGLFLHGVSLKVIEQFWHDLVERPDGPMRFRFVLQPVMATIVATRDGREDVRSGRSPYFVTVLGNPRERAGRLREGLNATARIIALGLVMDVIYQAVVFRTFYPDQALVVALVLAFLPYVIVREVISAHLAWSTNQVRDVVEAIDRRMSEHVRFSQHGRCRSVPRQGHSRQPFRLDPHPIEP